MSSHQFTLTQLRNPSALNPLIPANLPAHSDHLQSPTSSCLLLTNSQPPLPHFPPVPLPFLHFSPSYITAHSIPISAVSRNPAGFQDAQPSLELACSPARVPGAPRSHASSQRRPGSPPPRPPRSARLCAGALLHDSPGAAAQRGRGGPLAPHPRPITGPAADASPVRVSDTPAATSARVHGGRPRRAGPRARRVAPRAAGCVGRPAGGGGRAALHSGTPGSKAQNRPGSG